MAWMRGGHGRRIKVFCFFSSEKKAYFFMLTASAFRHLALALPGATEGAHQGHADFRRGKRVFATLGYPDADFAMVKLTQEQQRILTEAENAIFAPVGGGWGRGGATLMRLANADEATAQSALHMAWTNLDSKR
jgi:hypothetical protein